MKFFDSLIPSLKWYSCSKCALSWTVSQFSDTRQLKTSLSFTHSAVQTEKRVKRHMSPFPTVNIRNKWSVWKKRPALCRFWPLIVFVEQQIMQLTVSLTEFDSGTHWLTEIDNLNSNKAVRNLVLNHASLMIFQQNYLFQMICYDIQAAYQDTASQENLIVASHWMSCMIDSH